MLQTTRLGLVALEADLQDFLNEARLDAARAFRVLRDLGRIHPAAELDFIVRAPGEGRLARFGHPVPAAHLQRDWRQPHVFDPELVPVEMRPQKPFQGWRYLQPEAAPADLPADGPVAEGLDALPPRLRRELRELGLI